MVERFIANNVYELGQVSPDKVGLLASVCVSASA
jgi:hypothetical protein